MTEIEEKWNQATGLADNHLAAAILVLAMTIEEKHVFDRSSGENFGHEIAVALKNVLAESTVQLSGNILTETP